jgi:type VI secretion system secreted protein VgrG
MSDPIQANRNVAVNTALGEDEVLIKSVSISEQIGRIFQMEVELLSKNANIDFDSIVGTNSTIRLELNGDEGTRYFNGFVSRFVLTQVEQSYTHYHMTLVPWLWFLTRTSDCRIFQKKTVPEIIKAVFSAHGMDDFREALTGQYDPWEYCVQYRETDFNFVSRLMEHEGIYYFFEHENGKHTLVLADSPTAHKPKAGSEEIIFRPNPDGTKNDDYIDNFVLEHEIQPGSFVLNDFNFEKPKTALQSRTDEAESHAQANFEIYDYPGEYEEVSQGKNYSQIRIQELHAQYKIARGQSNDRAVAVGTTFTLAEFPRDAWNQKYLITSTSLHITGDEFESGSQKGGDFYSCSFTAIPATVQYRAPRLTPKPLIQGPQTAIVVGPKGEEIYTDQYGRIIVQFHWDRYGKADENSSCWVRVSQAAWAGKKWGAMALPRIGHEVIVEFLEGDPDRPIVTGQVYNADCTPPYDLPANKTRTTLKSNSSKGGQGFNEIRFEDLKGKEQIFIHAEKNQDSRTKNNSYEWIGNDRHLVVKHDQIEHVENNRSETVDADHKEKIGKDRHLKVAGKEAIEIDGSHSMTVQGDVIEVFQANHSEQTTQDCYVKAMNVIIEGMSNVTIKVGGSYVAIGPDGVSISGPQIQVDGSAMVAVKGGVVTIN